jgi:hypothetical protein
MRGMSAKFLDIGRHTRQHLSNTEFARRFWNKQRREGNIREFVVGVYDVHGSGGEERGKENETEEEEQRELREDLCAGE